jgi:UTP:GlnB (protein PII) uridylyltransferase
VLTPWKEDLLWRLYVHAYNRLTLGYADELLQKDRRGCRWSSPGVLTTSPKPSSRAFSRATAPLPDALRPGVDLPARAAGARHPQGRVHAFFERHGDAWELTLVTLDKPYLFSNISGVLSYFGMDIHRGQAMTTPEGLVLDVFQFADEGGFLRLNADAPAEMSRMLENVVAGSIDVPTLLRGKLQSLLYRNRRHGVPVVRFDNEHSRNTPSSSSWPTMPRGCSTASAA